MGEKKKVGIILTGGTIACILNEDNVSQTVDLTQRIRAIAVDHEMNISVIPFRSLKGYDMCFLDVFDISDKIRELIQLGSYSGFVVVMGTNLMEEAAFCLECLVPTDLPIVLTGAIRTPQEPSEDGTANLLAAIRTATSVNAQGLGVTILMNDTLHSAYYVRKEHTMLTNALTSDFPLGYIIEGRLSLRTRPIRKKLPPLRPFDLSKEVLLYTASLGESGALLSQVIISGYSGVVLEGSGGGNMPEHVLDILEELHKKIPIVIASRTGHGDVMRTTYGVGYGRPSDLIKRGYLNAGQLDGRKARVLLTLLLMSDADERTIRDTFDQFV